MTLLFLLLCLLPAPDPLPATEAEGLPFAIADTIGSISAGRLWPGFDPAGAPLAIFDGERTLLFRHPSPPPEFRSVTGRPDARAVDGRHTLIRANTSVAIGGVSTATLSLEPSETRSARELASLAVHEAFHVFQASRHPAWGGNEADLFTYPSDDAGLLQLSRLETEALRRALAAKNDRKAGCWAASALVERRKRFALLGESGAAYERGTELKEGLARLVESRARGETSSDSVIPANDFAAGDVRSRSYAIGEALGVLLDRLGKGWERKLEDGTRLALDELLAESVSTSSAKSCRFSRMETDEALSRARRSVELEALTRAAERRDFLARGGWKLVVSAVSEPLSARGFDPLNVVKLGPGEVLHTRWVKLQNASGSLEVLDARALTEAAGKHPLFEGVRRVTVAGIRDEPEVRESAGIVSVRAGGVNGEFRGARVERSDRTVTVLIGGSR